MTSGGEGPFPGWGCVRIMDIPTAASPPLSPVLLAGIALGPLPPVLLQPFLDAAMAVMGRRHPGLFRRLSALAGSTFRIDPVDLPFDFLLRPSPPPSLVAVTDGGRGDRPTATIHGPLLTLLHLLEGKLDGDALFFSRELVVEGDTEAVVMLRNAVDGAGIDLAEDVLSLLGPLARPTRFLAGRARAVITRMDRDLALLRRALLAPVTNHYEAQAAELRELRTMVVELRRKSAGRIAAGHARARGTRDK